MGRNLSGQCDVSEWSGITAISAGYEYTVGLKADGTVVATGGKNRHISDWSDITAISAGSLHIVGLKADGTVVAVGPNNYGMCDVSGWSGITAISAGRFHTVGLKADGTVVAAEDYGCGRYDVSGWSDVIAISAGYEYAAGLKVDGTVVLVGSHYYGTDVLKWDLWDSFNYEAAVQTAISASLEPVPAEPTPIENPRGLIERIALGAKNTTPAPTNEPDEDALHGLSFVKDGVEWRAQFSDEVTRPPEGYRNREDMPI